VEERRATGPPGRRFLTWAASINLAIATGMACGKCPPSGWLRYRDAAAGSSRTSPRTEKVTVGELLDDLVIEYKANGRRVDRILYSLAHLRPVFALRRAMQVSTADVSAYIVARQEVEAANATINRELAALKRAYSLATQATRPKLYERPYIPMLKEDNVRKGFFERAQYEAVLRHLPEALRPVTTVA
jgi:hypothetical protein